MTTFRRIRPTAAWVRPAFTLVELMVVVAIVGVLIALVAAAVTKVIPSQQQKNTERTIQKLNGDLQAHWRAVIDDAKEEFKRNPNLVPVSWTGGDPERGKAIWIKQRLVQQFPMSYQEIVLGGDPTYTAKLKAAGVTNPPAPLPLSTKQGREELASCLYIALTAKTHRGKSTQEDSFNADERGTNSTTGLPMIVDNWNQPLVYFRWPAGDLSFQGTAPKSAGAFIDNLDPTGRLADPSWNSAANSTLILNSIEPAIKHPIHLGNWTQVSFYLLPVVVSAGQDGDFGINDYVPGITSGYYMTPTPGSTAANDNIYSYLLK